ncbi:MAG: hypothetical protein MJE12_25440, partial [Alphaproteobacteria bacterium]|nr:hypothetical protein [Alphaproteobacteria bacterium]
DAWDWAEAIYQNAAGERDAYYVTELDVKTKAGWDDATYNGFMADLDTAATKRRRAAAGVMFKATGETRFSDIVEGLVGFSPQGWEGIAMWDYTQSVGADPTIKAGFLSNLETNIWSSLANYSTGKVAFRNQGFANNNSIGFPNSLSEVFIACVSLFLSGGSDRLDVMQAGLGWRLGANPYGYCYSNGLGARNFTETLHEDSIRRGDGKAPTGIAHYGWDFPGLLLKVLNFSTDSPLNFVVELPTGDFEADFGTARLYEPHRLSIPYRQHTVENRFIIFHMEYTFHQSIMPIWLEAMWLHAHDGNSITQTSNRKFGARF